MSSSNQAPPGNGYKALVLGLAALLACCGGAIQNGEVAANGAYRHNSYDYGIEPAGAQLMPETWRLDNFYADNGGKLVPKDDRVEIGFDLDGDDEPDEFEEFQAYDLVFDHHETAGQISIVAYPESGTDRGKRLEVLMARLLRDYASSGTWSVLITGESKPLGAHKENLTASVKQQGPATLAKREAYVATFDRINVEQAKVNADGRLSTVQLVLVRTGMEYQIKKTKLAKNVQEDGSPEPGTKEQVYVFPVMLLALYSNQPNLFAENLPDFRDLLNRVRIGNDFGFVDPSDAASKPETIPATATDADADPDAGVNGDSSASPPSDAAAPPPAE